MIDPNHAVKLGEETDAVRHELAEARGKITELENQVAELLTRNSELNMKLGYVQGIVEGTLLNDIPADVKQRVGEAYDRRDRIVKPKPVSLFTV